MTNSNWGRLFVTAAAAIMLVAALLMWVLVLILEPARMGGNLRLRGFARALCLVSLAFG
jgi:hypothetical protein